VRRAGLLAACVLTALVLATGASSAGRPPTGAALKLVHTYIAALIRGDYTTMCRLESNTHLGQSGALRRCVGVYRYLLAPGRPTGLAKYRERFKAGYRITRTRARFMPEDHCDPVSNCPVTPAYWSFKSHFVYRDGTHWECLQSAVIRQGSSYRFFSTGGGALSGPSWDC